MDPVETDPFLGTCLALGGPRFASQAFKPVGNSPASPWAMLPLCPPDPEHVQLAPIGLQSLPMGPCRLHPGLPKLWSSLYWCQPGLLLQPGQRPLATANEGGLDIGFARVHQRPDGDGDADDDQGLFSPSFLHILNLILIPTLHPATPYNSTPTTPLGGTILHLRRNTDSNNCSADYLCTAN
eukprot:superscaffoldBa00000223_g2874